MSTAAELVEEIEKLDPVARDNLLLALRGAFLATPQRFHLSDFPGVVKTPNVCGGAARIIRTRIPVWTLERMRQLGVSESDILRSFPSLRAVDLVQAWGYADAHAEEIAREIRENEEG